MNTSWTKVNGWETQNEQGLLAMLAATIPSPEGIQRIVEIGSEHGMSASIFAQYAPTAEIYCVELNPEADFLDNIHEAGYPTDKIFWLAGDSKTVRIPEKVAFEIDLLFIDGDHSYAGAYADLARWAPHCRSRGIIAVHDCACSTNKNPHASHHDVFEAVQHYLKTDPSWRMAFSVDSTVVLMRGF